MDAAELPFNYDEIADAYAAAIDASPYNAFYERPALLELLPPVRGKRILDAGCGSGWYAERLLELGAQVTGIDASPLMLAHARERLAARATGGPPPRLLHADLAAPLPFDDGSFDGVVSPLVLHYLRDWTPTLRELRRVLAPGGWLVFSTHHPLMEVVRLSVANYFEVEQITDHWDAIGTVRFFRRSLSEMSRSLAEAGLRIDRIVEPVPGEEFRRAKPEAYEQLLRVPVFILFRAIAP